VIDDDGAGFSEETQQGAARRGFGLLGIRERAELLGGKAEIKSSPGSGTSISVSISV
jgi:signal transduction histidine kinase